MCTESTTFVIDHEFAFYGPLGFDVGAFLANLFLAYFAQDGYEGDRTAQRQWLLACVKETWATFERRFRELWSASGVSDSTAGLTPAALYDAGAGAEGDASEALKAHQVAYMREVLTDSFGFAGAKMTRRVVGIAHVADLESIKDQDARAHCERRALACGRRFMLEAGSLSIEDAVAMAEGLRA
jgi:5-methylthioribose kinase